TESRALLDRHPDFSLQSATEQLLVYSHHGFRDAAWFVDEVQLVPPQPVELHRIDTARQAVVFVPGLRSATLKRFAPGNRVISFAENNAQIDIEVDCPAAGVLVVNTSFFPGWQASIDGSKAGVFMVDGGFMGLEVPRGAQTVRLRFAPAWLTTLFLFSTAAWIVLTTVFLVCVLPWLCRDGRPGGMTEDV
ncbi:MAG: YfhO family protein, partial [Planctomycetia bacterium]